MIEMGYNEEEQMNKLNEIEKNNKILQETIKLGKKILLLSFDELEEKVKNIIYYKQFLFYYFFIQIYKEQKIPKVTIYIKAIRI